mmetsp:Transcript_52042/g.106089  ORF Transcript_52042/g.106089 Transcript_52042/m.106089 type:complete len:206 (+) Transcript_52042:457-1074(+)
MHCRELEVGRLGRRQRRYFFLRQATQRRCGVPGKHLASGHRRAIRNERSWSYVRSLAHCHAIPQGGACSNDGIIFHRACIDRRSSPNEDIVSDGERAGGRSEDCKIFYDAASPDLDVGAVPLHDSPIPDAAFRAHIHAAHYAGAGCNEARTRNDWLLLRHGHDFPVPVQCFSREVVHQAASHLLEHTAHATDDGAEWSKPIGHFE